MKSTVLGELCLALFLVGCGASPSIPLADLPIQSVSGTPTPIQFADGPIQGVSGKIAFWSPYCEGICVMYVGESNSVSMLIKHGWFPAWSPDGKKIAFVLLDFSKPEAKQSQIYIANADGSDPIPVTALGSPRDYGYITWSPDGKKIAFEDSKGIQIINTDGSNEVQLAVNGRQPSWSPDGRKIAFVFYTTADNSDIYVMNADGSNRIRLTNDDLSSHPVWSPDGQKIAFNSWRGHTSSIYVMNADGSSQVRPLAISVRLSLPGGRRGSLAILVRLSLSGRQTAAKSSILVS